MSADAIQLPCIFRPLLAAAALCNMYMCKHAHTDVRTQRRLHTLAHKRRRGLCRTLPEACPHPPPDTLSHPFQWVLLTDWTSQQDSLV